ncbi:amino acid permease-domain-containing protein [Boletus reticuloceps]|uniref:Amino acid permease-domain-containing protein n=1 Tax=Boletus reticuloceps TaxID=495285 RepID=A0A8I2YM29_9AGAM|nr:amino acid permease-domain-containing protein [Boletus reticuloceps]
MTTVREARESDEAVLARLGYRQEFKRNFKPLDVFGIAFSIIGLLPSIACVLASVLHISRFLDFSQLCAFEHGIQWRSCVNGVGLGLWVVFYYVHWDGAGRAQPRRQLYYLTYTLSSPRSRNVLCWIVGYASTISGIAGIASVDWGCTVQIAAGVNIGSDGQLIISNQQCYGIYAAIVLSQAVICSLGTKVLARLQVVSVFSNILLCLVVIIVLPIASPKELKNPASYVFGNFTNRKFSGWPDGFAFILGLLAPLWTISGYDAVIHISEESFDAATAAPWGMVYSIAIAGVLGWAVNVLLAFCMGSDLSEVLGGGVNQPMAQIFLNSFGRSWALVLWSCIILLHYMTGSSLVLSASRQSFAFARDGALPFSKFLYQVNTYTGTPVNTVWFDCVLALLIGLLALLGRATVNAVFMISVTATRDRFALGVLGDPIAGIAVAFMLFMLVILCFPPSASPDVTTMNYTSVVLGGVMLLAMIWYYFPVYGGMHWFHGPTFNVEDKVQSRASVEKKAGQCYSVDASTTGTSPTHAALCSNCRLCTTALTHSRLPHLEQGCTCATLLEGPAGTIRGFVP